MSGKYVLSAAEAAQILGVSVRRLRHWANSGRLTSERHPVSGRYMYSAREIYHAAGRLDAIAEQFENEGQA